MIKRLFQPLLFICVLLGLLLLTACGGGGSASSGGSTATVSLAITDADTTYDKVVLTIKEIGVVTSDGATEYYNSDSIQELPTTVNVLDFPDTATFYLGDISIHVPEGEQICINQIRLKLAAEGDNVCPPEGCNYVVEEGNSTSYPLKTPSGQTSGVKILTPNEFCVSATNDTVELAIDFDPARAIVHNDKNTGNSDKYLLKPTGIRVIEGEWTTAADAAGIISGNVLIPSPLTNDICESLPTDPIPVITAALSDTPETVLVTTATLAQGPVATYPSVEDCTATYTGEAGNDAELAAHITACQAVPVACYYSGPFKLLLPPQETVTTPPPTYTVHAMWENLTGQETVTDVTSDTVHNIELAEPVTE